MRSLLYDKENPAIEALRGLAAAMVVTTHYVGLVLSDAGAWGFASTGVDLFFVLSGFVFAPYLFGKPLPIRAHLVRRFFRLYPLYITALLLYVALKESDGNAWRHFGVHLMMGHTLQSKEVAFYYNPAFWSLPPEVEFYLVLPLLAWFCRRIGFTWLIVTALAMHLWLAFSVELASTQADAGKLATVHLPGLLIEFLLGALAYAITLRLPRPAEAGRSAAASIALFGAGVLALIAALCVYGKYLAGNSVTAESVPQWVSGNMGLMAACGYMLMVAAAADCCHSTRPQLVSLFLWCGRLSYGVYLLHNASLPLVARFAPGLSGVSALLANISLTLLSAWLAHLAIEAPLRRWGRRMAGTLSPFKDHPTGRTSG